MNPKKHWKDRIQDLIIQYGGKKELADSLNVSVRTIYDWLKRETPPDSHNIPKVKRRERYQNIEKPKRQYKRSRDIEDVQPFEETPKAVLKRPLELFEFKDFGYEIEDQLRDVQLEPNALYNITINVFNAETGQEFNLHKSLEVSDLDEMESLAWAWARQANGIAGTSQLSLTVTSIG